MASRTKRSATDGEQAIAELAVEMWNRTYCPNDDMEVRASVLAAAFTKLVTQHPQQWRAVVDLLDAQHGKKFKYHLRRALLQGKALVACTIDDQCFLMDKLGYIESFLGVYGVDEWLRTLLAHEPQHLAALHREAQALGSSPAAIYTAHALVTRRLARPEWGDRFNAAKHTRLLRLVLPAQEVLPNVYLDIVQCMLVTSVEAEALLAQRFYIEEDERVKIREFTAGVLADTSLAAVAATLSLVHSPNLLPLLKPYSAVAGADALPEGELTSESESESEPAC